MCVIYVISYVYIICNLELDYLDIIGNKLYSDLGILCKI